MSEEQKLQEVKERNYQCALKLCKALDINIFKELEETTISIDDTEYIVYRIIENLFCCTFEKSMREKIEKRRKYYMYNHLLHIREEMGWSSEEFYQEILDQLIRDAELGHAVDEEEDEDEEDEDEDDEEEDEDEEEEEDEEEDDAASITDEELYNILLGENEEYRMDYSVLDSYYVKQLMYKIKVKIYMKMFKEGTQDCDDLMLHLEYQNYAEQNSLRIAGVDGIIV